MKVFFKSSLFIGLLVVFGCSKDNDNSSLLGSGNNSGDNEWLIPADEVRDGGPGKDGIPAIDNPQFSSVGQVDFLDPNDLVVLIATQNSVKAYPHPVLDWHEISNEVLEDGRSLSLTYCPLTGTAIALNSFINGKTTTFGVSGLLYNSNIIPYDRATDSNWSQMDHQCVNGPLSGTQIETFHTLETTFGSLRELFPDAQVLNTSTGFNRNYERYPYGDYRTNNNSLIFPVSNQDTRVPNKERVLGVIIDKQVMTYRFDSFNDQIVNIVQDRFISKDLVVIGSKEKNFLTAYQSELTDGTKLVFEAIQGELPIVMQDQEGNRWNLMGQAVEGPRTGENLPEVLNYIGYWFSWAAFNEGLEIYE